MKRRNKISLLILAFSSASVLASCNEEHVHSLIEHEEVFPTCIDTGTEAYQSCEKCGKYFNLKGEEITAPVVTPIDPNNHKGSKQLAIAGSFKTQYQVGEEFDMDNAKFLIKCEHCEGTELSEAKKAKINISYPSKDATSFIVDDLKVADLKVTFEYAGLSTFANVTLTKKSNAIEGLEPMNKHCGFKPFVSLEGVSSTFGTIAYSFAEEEDGKYKNADELGEDYEFLADPTNNEDKVFYVKASVAEGEDYEAASAVTTITISHNEKKWSEENEEYDVYGCVCQTPVKFFKKITTPQDVDLNAVAAGINLNGTSYDASKDTIKSVHYIADEETTYDLGTDLSNLDVTAIKEAKDHHGEGKAFEVVVTTPEDGDVPSFDHKIEVPATIITSMIYDNTDSFKVLNPIHSDDPDHCVKGYYRLAENISHASFKDCISEAWITDWAKDRSHYVFMGTLDGNNKTINGQTINNYGLFCQLEGATIKNLTYNDLWFREGSGNYPLLATGIQSTTFTNLTVKMLGGAKASPFAPDLSSDVWGWIAKFRFMTNTLTNCSFDATGYNIPVAFSSKNGNDNTFTDCSFKADTFGYLWNHYQKGHITAWEGLTVTGNIYTPASA